MTAPLLLMTGPPGSGKTTVAALVAGKLDQSAHVLGDHFFRYIRNGWLDPSLPESNDQNKVVIDLSARAAAAYAAAGYTTVLDGIYGPWFLDQVTDAVGDVELHYVVLRADLETCLQRAQSSDDGATDTIVRTMHEHFDELGQYERLVIDTTTATPDELCAEVIRRFEAGDLRLKD